MAIEKIELPSGTQGSSVSVEQKIAVWTEGVNYIHRLGDVLMKTGLFSGVRYEQPDEPTASSSQSEYTNGSLYKVWAIVGDDENATEVFAIGPYSFTVYSPSASTITYVLGAWLYVKYANGEYTLTERQHLGNYAACNIDLAYVTSNGVLFRSVFKRTNTSDPSSAVSKYGTIMIAKSNGRYPMICASAVSGSNSSSSEAQVDNGPLSHNRVLVANYGDQQYFRSHLPNQTGYSAKRYYNFATSAKQSVLVPFTGYGEAESYTYTAKGFWIPIASTAVRSGGFHKAHINNRNCVIDGYWALEDG